MMMFICVVSDDLPRKKLPQIYKPPTPEMLAYLDFSVSTTGILAGVKVSQSWWSLFFTKLQVNCECRISCSRYRLMYCGVQKVVWKLEHSCRLWRVFHSGQDTGSLYNSKLSYSHVLFFLQMSHAATSALCRSIKLQCELYPSRQIAICLDPYCGLGFALWCLCRSGSAQTHERTLTNAGENERTGIGPSV